MLDLQGHPAPTCLPPLPEDGPTLEVEFPEVEPVDDDDFLPSATISPDEVAEETELEEEDEQPLKRQRRDKAKAVVEESPSKRVELRDDGNSGSSSPSLKEPVVVEPLNMVPPVGGAIEFGGLFNVDDLGSDEEEMR